LKKQGIDWIHLAQVVSCEYRNEPLGPIKAGEFLDQTSNY